MLGSLLPIKSLAKRGLAGWLVLIGGVITIAITVMTLFSPLIVPHDPTAINVGPLLSPPSSQFPFGTDDIGRDMLSRVIAGGGVMLQVAVVSVLACLVIGVPLGLFASHTGGLVDKLVSLIMDSMYAFPSLILAIAIALVLGRGVINMALSITVVYIPSYFRVIRSQVLSIKELPYVEAANAAGAKKRTVLSRYILPRLEPFTRRQTTKPV